MRCTVMTTGFTAALFMGAAAQAADLKPFARNDEWTFVQTRTQAGRAPASNEIRFSTPFRKSNGDVVLAWAKAVLDSGQVVWQPIGTLPPTQCLRDFVGRTDLDLGDSCSGGLQLGAAWQSRSVMPGDQEWLQLVATKEEDIHVAAGTFHAIRIEGKGERSFSDRPPEALAVTYWFAPQAKAMVRAVREYRTAAGALTLKINEEMTAYKVN